jgi:hypothetical protein
MGRKGVGSGKIPVPSLILKNTATLFTVILSLRTVQKTLKLPSRNVEVYADVSVHGTQIYRPHCCNWSRGRGHRLRFSDCTSTFRTAEFSESLSITLLSVASCTSVTLKSNGDPGRAVSTPVLELDRNWVQMSAGKSNFPCPYLSTNQCTRFTPQPLYLIEGKPSVPTGQDSGWDPDRKTAKKKIILKNLRDSDDGA